MPLLFSYGTLQDEAVQLATFGRLLRGEREELPGFETAVMQDGTTTHANAQRSANPDARVSGTAFVVTTQELTAADEYEQAASYRRVLITLASGREAWVYVHCP
jgi:gamma-glutamylcyclotransferase (GGCT)/AIG2-like uncharacterized protein YtfP